MSQAISLTFLRNHGPYNKGDIASFPTAAANVIVSSGAATIVPTKVDQLANPAMPERTKSKIVKK